jgi:hypothetical protein
MATNKSVKATPAGKYPLGHAKENKDASAYVNNGTSVADGMSGVVKKGNAMDELKISVAGISKSQNDAVKTDGITMRGYGAATKGIKSRGPMA